MWVFPFFHQFLTDRLGLLLEGGEHVVESAHPNPARFDGDLLAKASHAISRSQAYFLRQQKPEGYWYCLLYTSPSPRD